MEVIFGLDSVGIRRRESMLLGTEEEQGERERERGKKEFEV